MNDNKGTNVSDLSRLRWMVVDSIKYTGIDCNATVGISSTACAKEQVVIVMRRLLKSMYGHEAQKQSQIDTNGMYVGTAFCGYPASIDNKVYVDMSDRTMWLAI